MAYFPLMLNLTGRKVLLISGGFESVQKAEALVAAGAVLDVMGEECFPEIEAMAQAGQLVRVRRGYQAGDVAPYHLVVSHPVDKLLNLQVAKEAEDRKTFIVAVDDTPNCSAILPSVHRQGDLVFAISTSGVAPALGVRIKERLRQDYGPEYAQFLSVLRSFREEITSSGLPFGGKKRLWYQIVDSQLMGMDDTSLMQNLRERLEVRVHLCQQCQLVKSQGLPRPDTIDATCCQEAL